MLYRVVFHFENMPQIQTTTAKTNPVHTREEAEDTLHCLSALPFLTGGHIERHMGPMGWVVDEPCDPDCTCNDCIYALSQSQGNPDPFTIPKGHDNGSRS